jgi:hypothetical protein
MADQTGRKVTILPKGVRNVKAMARPNCCSDDLSHQAFGEGAVRQRSRRAGIREPQITAVSGAQR